MMKLLHQSVLRSLALLALILTASVSRGQDDFTDGDFTNNPAWVGNTTNFAIATNTTIGNNSADGKFLASNPSTSNVTLMTESDEVSEWRFSLGSPNFDPSTANYFGVVLMSSSAVTGSITGSTWNGYYLRLGVDGSSDKIELWRRSGSSSTKVGDLTTTAYGSGGLKDGVNIRITRSAAGVFQMYTSAGFTYDAVPTTAAGSALTDNTHSSSAYFGVYSVFANAGSSRRVYIDNIEFGPLPPAITVSSNTAGSSYATTVYGTAGTTVRSFTVSGTNLVGGITITPPAGLQVRVSTGSYAADGAPITISGTSVSNTTIQIRLSPTATPGTTYGGAGNPIVLSSGDTTQNVTTGTGTVTPKALTVTGITASKVYDGTNTATLNTAILNGMVTGGTSVALGTYTATYDTANMGTGKGLTITYNALTGDHASYYTLTQPTNVNTGVITAKALTFTGGAAANKVYDGTTAAAIATTPSLDGIISPDEVTLIGTPVAQFANANAGTHTVTLTGGYTSSNSNYTLTYPYAGLSAAITPKGITVEEGTITVNNKLYDGTTAATLTDTNYTFVGVVEGDVVTLNNTGVAANFVSPEIGNGIAVTVTGYTLGGDDAANYSLTQPEWLSGNILDDAKDPQTITLAETLTATYGDADFSPATASSGLAVTYSSSNEAVATVVNGQVHIVSVGTTTITANQAGDDDYNPAEQVAATLTVNPKVLTPVNASIAPKVYDAQDTATGSGDVSGVVPGDVVAVTFYAFYWDVNAGTNKEATVEFTINDPRYTFVEAGVNVNDIIVDVTGTITKAPLTIATQATAQNKVYDATTTAAVTGGTVSGTVNSESVTPTVTGTFIDPAVGTAKTVNLVYSLPATGAAVNYELTQTTGTTAANITALALTITGVTANDKTYDQTDAATLSGTPALNGVIGDDIVTPDATNATAAFNNATAATGKPVTVAGFALAGEDAANYTVAQPTGVTATISQKTITADITGVNPTKVYNGTTAATFTGVVLDGVISPDAVTATSGIYTTKNAGEGNGIAITLGGAQAANYTLTQPGLTGTITKKDITATADAIIGTAAVDPFNVNLNTSLPSSYSIRYAGIVGSDATAPGAGATFTAPTATTTATSTASAGAYPVTLTGGDATNYNFTALNPGWLVVGNPPSGNVDLVNWTTGSFSSPLTAESVHANINDAPPTLIRGSFVDATSISGTWGGGGSDNWQNEATGNEGYGFYFTITVDTGNTLSLNTLSTATRRSGAGPDGYVLYYSLNGAAYVQIGSATTGSSSGTTGTPNSHSLSGIAALQNLSGGTTVKFLIQPYGSTTGNYYLTGGSNMLRVTGAFGTPTQAPAISSALTDASMFGTTDEYVITASGTPEITYTATNLPAGATYDAPNHKIVFDGSTPTGVYNITLNASSYYSQAGDTKTLVYTVRNFTVAPSPVTGLHAYAGQANTNLPVQLQSIVGENLTNATNGTITVTAGTGFRISTNNQVSYGTSGTISYSGTSLSLTNPNIFVKLADGLAVGEYNGTLTFTGGGITKVVNINGLVETAPGVTTTAAAYGPYCAGTANGISVAFTTQGNFGAGNFYVQHSDAAGVFPALFENIISNAGTTSPIAATLPNTLAAGNYRVRVIHLSSGLVITGSTNDNGSDIVINAIPTLTGVSTQAVCTDGNATIALAGLTANTAFTVDYTLNGGAAQQAAVTADVSGNGSFTLPVTFANNGQQVVVTALTRSVSPACAQTFSTNNSAALQVNPAPTATIASAPAAVCQGGASVISLEGMIANSSANVSYTIDGNEDIVVPVVADAEGKGSFTVTLAEGSHLLEIITIVRTDVTPACMGAVNASTTVVVNQRPTAVISAAEGAICYGATTQVSIALTGAQPWNITYNNGTEDVVVNNVTTSPYVFDVTPTANVAYTLVAVEDAACQAVAAGLTGTAAITVNQNTWTGAANNNNWNDAANWSCGGVPTAATPATIGASGFNPQVTATAQALSLTVSAGAVLTVKTGGTLTVQNEVVTNGTLTVENNAALVQVNDVANTGAATILRNSNELYRLDYTLWGAPVSNLMLGTFSPLTASTRFFSYGLNEDGLERYLEVPSATIFAEGSGYLIRMPNNLPDVPGYNTGATKIPFNGQFTGVPNNGNVGVPAGELVDHYIALGNPYASPIGVVEFFEQNSNVIEAGNGIYFWRKRNDATASSYAHLTLTGFTANTANGGDMDDANGAFYYGGNDGSSTEFNENWIISPGQGFLVKLRSDITPTTEVVFTNSMRRSAPAANGQPFFRTQNNNDAPAVSRWWINISGANAFSQALVGYMPQATTGLDYGYDARAIADGTASLYSKEAENNLAIQAKPSFVNTDVVPMGFSVAAAGQYTLSLDHVDGVFAQGQDIFVKDNLTGVTHNLQNGAYTFTTGEGSFDTRFEVVYQPSGALGTEQPELANMVLVYQNNGTINITSGSVEMTGVTLYDIRGRKLHEQTGINATQAAISNLAVAQQVLIVEIQTVKGTVTKRIVY